jgi:predicted nucleotidyltransferase
MSGAAGGTRINKENLKNTIRDYRENILKPLGLDKSYSITGIRSRPEKDVFGDIDIVLSFPGGDKKELKQNLAKFLESKEQVPVIPKKNKKYFIHGNIVSILYPISDKKGEYVQIDNIVTSSEEEGKFTYKMLDLPAQEQVMAIGLVKTIFTELDNNQIQKLFAELGLTNIEKPSEKEEYDFNLNPSGLSLRIVPIGKNEGKEIWNSNDFNDVKTITKYLGIDIEKDKFSDVIPKIKKFKNRRSIDRFKGMFNKNIRVGDAEIGTEKGIKKQQALDAVSVLENKYNSLVMSLIKPFITEETIPPQIIALMPGAFKPPHKDHLKRINAAARNSDKALILISPLDRAKEREQPISAKQSLAIWQLFKDKGVLEPNVEFFISQDNAPVKTAYDIAATNPQIQYIGVYGKEDAIRWKNLPNEKYPNLRASDFNIVADLSASDLRKALLDNEDITPWMPEGISSEEYKQALGINNNTLEEEIVATNLTGNNYNILLEEITPLIKELGDQNLIYRGFGSGKFGLGKVVNEKDKGLIYFLSNKNPELVNFIKKLGIENLVFTSLDKNKAKRFGPLYIFIPKPPYKAIYNPDVDDLYGNWGNIKQNPDKYISSYKEGIPSEGAEVIFDVEEYYLLAPDWYWVKSKGQNIKTYEDLYDILPKKLNEDIKNPDIIPGGMAKGKSLQDIVNKHKDWSYEYMKDQLDKGIKVELEHTTSKEVATEITMDHLWEDPQYYIKLSKIEQPIQEVDPKVGTGKKPKESGRRLYTDENPKDTVSIKFKTKEDIAATLNKSSFKSKSHARQSQIINLIHQRVRAAYQNAKDPETKARLKRGLEYITAKKEASKEKTKRLKKLDEMSISNLKAVEDYADSQLDPIDVEFTNHFFDRLNDPRNIKPISAAELVGFFKRLSRNKKELISFLSKYKEIVAKDTQTNINIPLVNDVNKIIAKTIMRKPDFQTSNPVLAFEELNEVEISGFTSDINKAMELIEDESVDPKTRVKAIHPYEETKYIPLLDSGVPFHIKGKIKYKDEGEIKTTDTKVYIGFATLDPNIGGLALTGHDENKNFTGESVILINTDLYNQGRFNEIESVIDHELTHGIDPALSTKKKTRTQKSLKRSIDPEKKEYWTSSVEMAARVNEIVRPLETKILKPYQDAVDNDEITQEEFNKIKQTIVEYIIYVLVNEDGKFNTRHISEYMEKRGIKDIETQDVLNTIYEDILYRWLMYHHGSLKIYNPQYPKNIIKGIINKLKIKELVSEEQNITEYKNQDELNPKVWENNKLKIKLREALLKVSQKFYDSLNINLPLEDVLLLGSLANYNWTDASDIDLHLLIDYKSKKHSDLLGKYFESKKDEFNNKYNLIYQGHPVEVYVQDTNDPSASQGVYSILNNKWVIEPKKENIEIDDFEIAKKAQPIMNQIDELIANPETATIDIDKLKEKIKQFRQAGLDEKGEYSLENLAFKQLRYNGYLEKLNNLKQEKTIKGFGLDSLNESINDILEQPINDLIKYALKNGYNINPLPDAIFIDNDIENANDLLGRTAHYNPNNHSITLYTLNRHPKDVLRSYAHELIHHIQNLEDRLQNISTDNINEDEYLRELEREAYEKGNLLLRGWENALKNSVNEWIIDIPKYNHTPKLSDKLFSQLHELKVNEIILNSKNAVEIEGDLFGGEFKAGNMNYVYSIKNIPNPYKDDTELFYNIQFDEKNNDKSSNEPTGNARENYIKILSTMYKIILNFVEKEKPKYIGISSLDKSGYGNIYNNLTKTNKLPGYSRKDAGLDFTSKSGDKGKFIVLKRND